jgi:putative membrane protein
MIIEVIIAILIGCLLGTITGLTPGVHINLISVLILASSPFLLNYTTPLYLAIVIGAMAITHTFLDNIPSIFLGAPDASTILQVLPGHKMLLKGHGYAAVILATLGSLFALILSIALAYPIIKLVQYGYPLIKSYIGYILIASSCLLIIREKNSRFWAFFIFLISGILGILVFNLSTLRNPLFPLLSGLFGISTLFLSYNDNVKIPQQVVEFPKIKKSTIAKALSSSMIAGTLCSFLPGIGPSQGAILGSTFTKLKTKGYLILNGAINTMNMVLSFIAAYVIAKPRNGAIVILSKILQEFNSNHLILFLGVILITACIATLLTINISKVFSKFISKINYKILCLSIISLVSILVFILSGFLGLFVLLVSTFIGFIPALKGAGRNHLMGCLLLPVILYFVL